jgi:predicted nucleic acid-binding protein
MKIESAITRNDMPEINLFLASSALMAGILSADGAARVLLLLAENGQIGVTISEQVLTETERSIARKVPKALNDLRQAILASQVRVVRDPSPEDISGHPNLASHPLIFLLYWQPCRQR